MAITNEDIVALASAFYDASMVKKSTAAEMAEFFLYPESRIFVLHGGNLTPERAQAQGIVYWQGRHVEQADGALLKRCVGEDWVVERVPSGELKLVIYVNSFHRFLPDAGPIELR